MPGGDVCLKDAVFSSLSVVGLAMGVCVHTATATHKCTARKVHLSSPAPHTAGSRTVRNSAVRLVMGFGSNTGSTVAIGCGQQGRSDR